MRYFVNYGMARSERVGKVIPTAKERLKCALRAKQVADVGRYRGGRSDNECGALKS